MSLITPAYTQALAAAAQAVAGQQHPTAVLYMVATPIGNLADIGLRALHVLSLADTVACEDTRHTGHMLQAYGLHKPLLALHEHNENQAAQTVLQKLQQGERVVYVSDAGTPAVSDPGSKLVLLVRNAGHRVMPLPGASCVTTLLSAIGCLDNQFAFMGFLPAKGQERTRALLALKQSTRTTVLLEAPHRMEVLAKALAQWDTRLISVGRELTKQFESIVTLQTCELLAWLQADAHRLRGEFVLALHPAGNQTQTEDALPVQPPITTTAQDVLTSLLKVLPLKTAVQAAQDICGQPKNTLYGLALKLQNATPAVEKK